MGFKSLVLICLSVFCYIFSNQVFGQSLSRTVICSTGNTVSAGDYSISYVLGEAVGDLFSNDPKLTYLTAGFAQPDQSAPEIYSNNTYISANFAIYPNPAVGNTKIKLGFKNLPNAKYSLAIIDATGKITQTEEFYYSPLLFAYREYDVSNYAKGVYYVKVLGAANFKATLSFLKQ